MIGLALLSGLLSILLSFFSSSAKVDVKLEKAQAALLERQHVSQRLQSIFTSILPPTEKYLNSLYTKDFPEEKNSSLIVYFDHGIDPDPAFSGPSLGRIYLDNEHRLCLAIWPKDRDKERSFVRQEVLLHHVRDIRFQFIAERMNQKVTWENKRSEEEHLPLPCLVRLDLWQEKNSPQQDISPLQFAFILPSNMPEIVYSPHEKPQ